MKISKLFTSLALIGILSGGVYAETPDEEIARLKKENELLELQKKNEELKKGKGSESKKSVNVDKSGAFGFCKGEYANTGCFIGAEVGYASATNYLDSLDLNFFSYTNTYALPINLIFGWQWYFSEKMGLNIKANIGYASYNSDISMQGQTAGYKSSAIHYGLELAYLYDFVSSTKHTFGIHAKAGYEFGTFVGQGVDMPGATINPIASLDSYTKSAFIGGAGVHYFLNIHHQFWLSYKSMSYSGVDGGSTNVNGQNLEYYTAPNSLVSFAYAYKF